MRAFLTGATGFVGRYVLEALLSRGDTVCVLVRPETLARSPAARSLAGREGVQVIEGTITDEEVLSRATEGVDVVYHLAWRWSSRGESGGVAGQSERPVDAGAIQANIKGAEYLLAASVASRVRRLVFVSTVAVYGPPGALYRFPVSEDTSLFQRDYGRDAFTQGYMAPKIAIENTIRSYARQCGLEFVILRPSVVYGPDAPFAARLVRQILNSPRWVSPDASPVKLQLVHVRDAARAILLAGTEPEARNREFNIAGNEVISDAEIKILIWNLAAGRAQGEERRASRSRSATFQNYDFPRYDISRSRAFLKYEPQVPLRLGIEEMASGVLSRMGLPDAEVTDGPERDYTVAHILSSPSPPELSGEERTVNRDRGDALNIREFYDERVESDFLGDYFERSGFWNFGYRISGTESPREACEQLLAKLLGFIPERKGRLLDVACGVGATTAFIGNHYPPQNVAGINFSLKQLDFCRVNAPGSRFYAMDATAMGLADNSFDNILCVEAAFHFETREKFLREALRVLKPGGRLIMSDALLPARAQIQPRENYVASATEYGEICRRVGFADAVVVDATNECWGAFAADLADYTRRKWRAGEIPQQRFFEIMVWLRHLGPELYVLVSCGKGGHPDK